MPKKGKKSIGQSTAKVRKLRLSNQETAIPSESQEVVVNSDDSILENVELVERMEVSTKETSIAELNSQPGPSGLGNLINSAGPSFEVKILQLKMIRLPS